MSGMSIPELVNKYKIPKTSIWYHVHDVLMSNKKQKLILSRRGGSRLRKERDLLLARKEAQQMLHNVDVKKSGILIFIALYWSEGSNHSFVFTNTDADMIRMFIRLTEDYLGVSFKDITALIRINDQMDSNKCVAYWKKVTKFPSKNISVNINNKQNKTKTKYGICRLTLKKGGYRLKLTDALIKELVAQYS